MPARHDFKQRLDDPARHWKISAADYSERKLWQKYQLAYEEALARTSTKHAPWFVIPANHKWFRNLAVSRIVTETLESLGMEFPPPSVDIEEIRRQYHDAKRTIVRGTDEQIPASSPPSCPAPFWSGLASSGSTRSS